MRSTQFRVGGIPVRVEPVCLFTLAFLGWATHGNNGMLVAIFVVVAGASLLLHEMGHATAYRSFGAEPTITLGSFGGYTLGPPQPRGRSMVVSLAGPGAGFLGAIVGVLLSQLVTTDSEVVKAAIDDLIYVNVLWGVFNLLPILPLDGGHFAADLFGRRQAQYLSLAGAVVLGVVAISLSQPFMAIFAFMFGSQSLNALRAERDKPQLEQLNQARVALLQGRYPEAAELAASAGANPASFPVEVTAAELLAWAHLAENHPDEARAALDRLRGGVSKTSLLVQRMVALAEGRQGEQLAPAFIQCDDVIGATIAARMVTAAGLLDRLLEELPVVPVVPGRAPRTNGYRALQLGLHHAGRYRDAARVGDILFKSEPDPLVAYNVACSWALAGDTEQALTWLDRAVEKGFRDTALIDGDNNFNAIRDTDGFRAVRSWMEAAPPGGSTEEAAGT
jgi:Zn-dependent protease